MAIYRVELFFTAFCKIGFPFPLISQKTFLLLLQFEFFFVFDKKCISSILDVTSAFSGSNAFLSLQDMFCLIHLRIALPFSQLHYIGISDQLVIQWPFCDQLFHQGPSIPHLFPADKLLLQQKFLLIFSCCPFVFLNFFLCV